MLSPQDAKCTFLHHVDDVLKDVGKVSIVQPKGLMMHNKPIPAGWFRVRLVRAFKGCKRINPPGNPREPKNIRTLMAAAAGPCYGPRPRFGLRSKHPPPHQRYIHR